MLREISLESTTPILAATQVNREGERSTSRRPPGTNNLAGSDALGQDADVVVTGKRTSTHSMAMSAEKTRNGPSARWYTEFMPDLGRFDEINRERANELIAQDINDEGDYD